MIIIGATKHLSDILISYWVSVDFTKRSIKKNPQEISKDFFCNTRHIKEYDRLGFKLLRIFPYLGQNGPDSTSL